MAQVTEPRASVGVGAVHDPGCLSQLRAARSSVRDDSPDGRPPSRGAHQELRQVRRRRRSRRAGPADLQARDRHHRNAARGRELLLAAFLTLNRPFSRVILIVLDSVGCGELPDAAAYGDEGSDTLGNIARQVPLGAPAAARAWSRSGQRQSAGRSRQQAGRIDSNERCDAAALGAYGRMAEASAGKDSVTGHWEMMGIVLDRPFPTFPPAFRLMSSPSSNGGSAAARLATSSPRAPRSSSASAPSTSAPASRSSTPQPTACSRSPRTKTSSRLPSSTESARLRSTWSAAAWASAASSPGRSSGAPVTFTRTANRHDYALEPFGETLLDLLTRAHVPVVAVGKTGDLFAGRGIQRSLPTSSDERRRRHDSSRR